MLGAVPSAPNIIQRHLHPGGPSAQHQGTHLEATLAPPPPNPGYYLVRGQSWCQESTRTYLADPGMKRTYSNPSRPCPRQHDVKNVHLRWPRNLLQHGLGIQQPCVMQPSGDAFTALAPMHTDTHMHEEARTLLVLTRLPTRTRPLLLPPVSHAGRPHAPLPSLASLRLLVVVRSRALSQLDYVDNLPIVLSRTPSPPLRYVNDGL